MEIFFKLLYKNPDHLRGGKYGRQSGQIENRPFIWPHNFLAPSLIELTAYQKLYFKISGGSPVPSLYYYPLISDVNNLVQYERKYSGSGKYY